MRPASEAHLAVLQAAHAIKRERLASGQGATLRELVERAFVGYKVASKMRREQIDRVARQTVSNLTRHKKLCIVGERRVSYRNKPVAEYSPTLLAPSETPHGRGVETLCTALSVWNR